jgi:hypothetical protein
MMFWCKTLLLVFLLNCWTQSQAQFHYAANTSTDLFLYGTSISLATAGFFADKSNPPLTPLQLDVLSSEDVFVIDRKATQNWSPMHARISDAGLLICVLSPLVFTGNSSIRNNALVTGMIYSQTLFLTTSFTMFSKSMTKRVRPFAYNESLTQETRTEKDVTRSFFSGHTSLAFCSAVFTSTVFSKHHSNKKAHYLIWGSSLALASSVGVLRYTSGKHFPTDIIAGAIVGSVIGYAVPKLHEKKSKSSQADKSFQLGFIVPL